MDTELRKLSNDLDIHGTGLTILAMDMHSNDKTAMYNAKQIKHYFTQKLITKDGGLHMPVDSNVAKFFGKSFAKKLASTDYPTAKKASDKLDRLTGKVINKNHLSYLKMTHYGTKPDVMKTLDSMSPKDQFLAKRCLTFSERLDDLMWIHTMKKHPNYMSIPSRFSNLLSPVGVPDGSTPKEATKSTKKYIKFLKKQTVWSPKHIISYCKKHLQNANNKIIHLKNQHKGIHYKKFLTNDSANLRLLHNMGMEKGLLQDLELEFKKSPSNYKEALYWIAYNKIPYVRVMNRVESDLKDGQKDYSFENDINGNITEDYEGGREEKHHVSDLCDIADYYNYAVGNKPFY